MSSYLLIYENFLPKKHLFWKSHIRLYLRTLFKKMHLFNLAHIFEGLTIEPKSLSNVATRPNDFIYLSVENLTLESSIVQYLTDKESKRTKTIGISPRDTLQYGDYLIYRKLDEFKIHRYSEVNKRTLAGRGIIIIRPELGILQDFLGYEKNRRYFCQQLNEKNIVGRSMPTIEQISNIDIPVDNILELVDPNIAEEIGITDKVNTGEIFIIQKSIPMDKLMKRIEHGELQIDSEFQRRPGLWGFDVKSRLIESMIVKIPIPAFYFDGSDDNKWKVIDGLQRLSAVNSFIKGEFPLTNLDYLPEIEDKTFEELDRQAQRNIEEYEVFAYILQKGTPPSVKYKIFKSINTSSLKLEPQEIRHALNPGPPAEFVKEIAESQWFKNTVKISDVRRERMEDREVALRFVAFKRTRYSDYKPDMVQFLDTAMTDIYNTTANTRLLYKEEFRQILETITTIFGEEPFGRALFDPIRPYRHNNTIFELLTFAFSIISASDREKMLISKTVAQRFKDFFSGQPSRFWETEFAYSKDGLQKRFQSMEEFVQQLKKIL